MYTKTFTGNTLDETLKSIKSELGPEAIILKTVTNKGLKNKFKKNRIEITAAITEKDYIKKGKVDKILDESQTKEKFYQNKSSHISQMINDYGQNQNYNNYGKLAINKEVKSKNLEEDNELNEFLSRPSLTHKVQSEVRIKENSNIKDIDSSKIDPSIIEELCDKMELFENNLEQKLSSLYDKIELLESKADKKTSSSTEGNKAVVQVAEVLKSYGVNQNFINKMIENAVYNFTEKELNHRENMYEYFLYELEKSLHVKKSAIDQEKPSISVYISQVTSGQTSTIYKVADSFKRPAIIKVGCEENNEYELAKNLLGVEVHHEKNIDYILSKCRSLVDRRMNVFIDLKIEHNNETNIIDLIDKLKDSFVNVESYAVISSIVAEEINKKFLLKIQNHVDGLIATFLDKSLGYGQLINIGQYFSKIPYLYFSTGKKIPSDLEEATVERLLSEIIESTI